MVAAMRLDEHSSLKRVKWIMPHNSSFFYFVRWSIVSFCAWVQARYPTLFDHTIFFILSCRFIIENDQKKTFLKVTFVAGENYRWKRKCTYTLTVKCQRICIFSINFWCFCRGIIINLVINSTHKTNTSYLIFVKLQMVA